MMVPLFLDNQAPTSFLADDLGVPPELVLLPFWHPALDQDKIGILTQCEPCE